MAGRGGDTIREFSFLVLCITACTRVQPAALKKKKSHNPHATGQNNSENCGPTTRSVVTSPGGGNLRETIIPRKDPARAIC